MKSCNKILETLINKNWEFYFANLASPYSLVHKANLVHSFFSVYLFLVYLSISRCFVRLCAHHQGKQLCLCDTWYLLFCVDNKYQVSHNHSCFPWWWAHSRTKHVEIDKYTKKKLCTKLALFPKKEKNRELFFHKVSAFKCFINARLEIPITAPRRKCFKSTVPLKASTSVRCTGADRI